MNEVAFGGHSRVKIQTIVEGHGDVAAFPVLLRRLVLAAEVWEVEVGKPIRRPRSRLVDETGVRQAVRLAALQTDCGAVLILLDGDDDCPADLGPTVQGRQPLPMESRVGSCWRTENTKPGF